jgi:hypothetical protein
MNMLIDIITWGINCHLERSCAILLKPVQPMIFLAVFSFPVQPGRWRHGTDGLVGRMSNERSTYKRSLITAGFLFYLGLRSKTLPVQFLRWLSRPFRMIGNAATAIALFLWKHWLPGNDSEGLAIRRPTGYPLEKRRAAGGWTGAIHSRTRRSRRFMFTPLHPDFVKNWRGCKRGALWELLRLALLKRIQQGNFDT